MLIKNNNVKILPISTAKISTAKNSPFPSKDSQDLVNLQTQIENYTHNYQGEYGVYYYNLDNGDEFGINDEDSFTAASCEKIPINLLLYNKICTGAVDPNSSLTYSQQDYEDGTGVIQYQNFGAQYTLAQLSVLSIEYSDNVATNMLIRFLGLQNIKDYMRQLGGTTVIDDQNVSTPKDMAIYMQAVYQFCNNNGANGNVLMNSFLNTKYNDRIPALLPGSVKVAHKIGTEVGVINDVGIVYANQPYIISIMSKGVIESQAPAVLANISRMIYNAVSQGQ